jgi:hypothetical protein
MGKMMARSMQEKENQKEHIIQLERIFESGRKNE